jgi:hypothetical protein
MVDCSQPLPEPRRGKVVEVTKDVVIMAREKQQQDEQQSMREVSNSLHCRRSSEERFRTTAHMPLSVK